MHTGIYVVMGVSGSGKSLIGEGLARALGVPFVEGDAYHPPENVARMAAGIPLTDADRRGWLAALAARIGEARRAGVGLVISCSALKRSYRDVLRAGAGAGAGAGADAGMSAGAGAGDVRFIFLKGSRDLIAARLAGRSGHFMPPSLLDSQFATLEEPSPDEHPWECDITAAPESIVADLVARAKCTT
jgi:carbohydrate kinase (thermoresistant glucokinase family)